MALTTLDPKTALLVIDLQNGILALPASRRVDEVISRAGELADAFRGHGLPVVLITVAGAPSGRTEQRRRGGQQRPVGWADLVPGLNQQPGDHTVTKRTWGAFTNTDLAEHLRGLEVTQVVIVGVATSIGVESTARHAHEHGLNVTLAVDAMTDSDPEAHANSVARIFPRLGETGTTREIIDLLDCTRS